MNSIMHEINGLAVPQSISDGYVNATKLCKAAGKKLSHWYSLDSTKKYLEALSLDPGIPISTRIIPQLHSSSWQMSKMSDAGIPASDKHGLITIGKGGKPEEQGTWVQVSTPRSYCRCSAASYGQLTSPGSSRRYVRQLCSPEECHMVARAIGYDVKPMVGRSAQ